MVVGWCRYRGKSISNEKRYMTRKKPVAKYLVVHGTKPKKMIHVWYNGISTKKINPS